MAANRRHHFVPQFYLRYFSEGAHRQIATFIINRWKFVPQTSIKDQAYRPNFYRSVETEKALAELEGACANVLRQTLECETPPLRESDDHPVLALFMLLSRARTPSFIERGSQALSDMTREMIKDVPAAADLMEVTDLSPPDSMEIMMSAAITSLPYAMDLQPALVFNESGVPFVTSDNPCVLWNPLLENKKRGVGITGIAEKGLVMTIPISPSHALLLYDDTSYRLDDGANRLILRDRNSADFLNKLQATNCSNQLFAKLGTHAVKLTSLVTSVAKFRRNRQAKVQRAPLLNETTGEWSEVIHMRGWEPRIGAHLAGMRLKAEVRNYQPSERAVEIRNPTLYHGLRDSRKPGGSVNIDDAITAIRNWVKSRCPAGGTDKPESSEDCQ